VQHPCALPLFFCFLPCLRTKGLWAGKSFCLLGVKAFYLSPRQPRRRESQVRMPALPNPTLAAFTHPGPERACNRRIELLEYSALPQYLLTYLLNIYLSIYLYVIGDSSLTQTSTTSVNVGGPHYSDPYLAVRQAPYQSLYQCHMT